MLEDCEKFLGITKEANSTPSKASFPQTISEETSSASNSSLHPSPLDSAPSSSAGSLFVPASEAEQKGLSSASSTRVNPNAIEEPSADETKKDAEPLLSDTEDENDALLKVMLRISELNVRLRQRKPREDKSHATEPQLSEEASSSESKGESPNSSSDHSKGALAGTLKVKPTMAEVMVEIVKRATRVRKLKKIGTKE